MSQITRLACACGQVHLEVDKAPIVSSEQFSARSGSSNAPPQHSVRTALTPIDDEPVSESSGLGSFITTKPAAKDKQLPPIMSPEEHKQRAMRR